MKYSETTGRTTTKQARNLLFELTKPSGRENIKYL